MSSFSCGDARRRAGVLATGGDQPPNGIDHVEVVDTEAADPSLRQRLLRVHLLKDPLPPLDAVSPQDVRVEGGVRVTGIDVEHVTWDGRVLEVLVDRPGDRSPYTLRLGRDTAGSTDDAGARALGLDPRLAAVTFDFKVDCPDDLDCVGSCDCRPVFEAPPEIDYLARDYATFRQLMLDRLSVLVPDWGERNPADLGIAMVEVLAYVADHLSYELDAIGMESTLLTARRRSSVRRHARLVDYAVDDGANARTWVSVDVDGEDVALPAGTQVLSRVPGVPDRIDPASDAMARAEEARPVVFETMHDAVLQRDRNELRFHTWGDRDCCLPAGATSATLRGHPPLEPGDVIMMAEGRCDDDTGIDPDGSNRHVVRLVGVQHTDDPIGSVFDDAEGPPTPVDVTEVAWAAEDALPFSLCVSTPTDPEVGIVLGNVVLADHGRTTTTKLAPMPAADPRLDVAPSSWCGRPELVATPPRFRPVLDEAPLTMVGTLGRAAVGGDQRVWERFDPSAPASSIHTHQPRHVVPDVHLVEDDTGRDWRPRRDLLASSPFAPEFVAEPLPDGRVQLRFGDDEYGLRPAPGTTFVATYRVGSGPVGNVGACSLGHVVTGNALVLRVRNPLPARGGRAPESLERVRQRAPSAFLVPQRAVTPDDYAEVAERHPAVQRAVATERWTGSWHTIFLTIDRVAALPVDDDFEGTLRDHLERFRMAGHDLEIDGPRYVPVELELRVCVLPDYYRSDVRREVVEVLGSTRRGDGSRGLFHPDEFTFGEPVRLSRIYAVAQSVAGVRHVEALALQRLDEPATSGLDSGLLPTGRIEIPRLDNDPNVREHGVLRLRMEGGR